MDRFKELSTNEDTTYGWYKCTICGIETYGDYDTLEECSICHEAMCRACSQQSIESLDGECEERICFNCLDLERKEQDDEN